MTKSTKLLVSLLVFSGVTISLLSDQLLVPQRQAGNSDRANSSDGYKQGTVKSAVSEKINIQPTAIPQAPFFAVLTPKQVPAKHTQTVYVGSLNLTTQCLTEGVDAIKTADSTIMSSFKIALSCIEDRKRGTEDCIADCDVVYSRKANLCVTNYQVLGYSRFDDCINGERSERASCAKKCIDPAKQNMENCLTLSRRQEDSLKSLIATYCNK